MEEQLIDFDFLEQLSGGDTKFKYELLGIFMDTMDQGLDNLQMQILDKKDMDATFKQAHALKSSAGVVKVKDMHAHLSRIEELGRADTGIEEIEHLLTVLMDTYKRARTQLATVRDKNKTAE